MKQSWMLVNLDRNEMENISSLGRRMLNGSWDNLIGMLAQPTGIKSVPDLLSKIEQDTTADFKSDKERKSNPPPQRNTLGRLELFPDEVLLCIFDHIHKQEDVASLSLTSRYVYNIGYEVLQRRYMTDTASWAGCRLVCIGYYAEFNDLPPGVFTSQELDEMKDRRRETWNPKSRKVFTLQDSLLNRPKRPMTTRMGPGISLDAYDHLSMTFCGAQTDLEYQKELKLARTGLPYLGRPQPTYASDYPWLLCNLSKLQFIRLDAITRLHGRKLDPDKGPFQPGRCSFGRGFSIGMLLVSRICWSTDSTASLAYKGNIHRGVWVGDRFEITTTDRMQTARSGQEWRDVTDEVLNEGIEIWKAEYGKNWREKL
ncbi:unnamed protein product [Somion occarium]|uniref:F-box domain-containing protein n=1 Tax=Somion occarium TaxID=3059160 RepID=A0ABP1CMW9_9APHY